MSAPSQPTTPTDGARVVVIGRNSTVWKRLREHPALAAANVVAIGHGEVAATEFKATDAVWIFSYSRDADENRALMELLRAKGAASYHYLSTATVNVAALTGCYSYPRAKAEAERDAIRILNAEIVRVGVVYGEEVELPAGRTMATSLDAIAEGIIRAPCRGSETQRNLFAMVERPFRSGLEREVHRLYGLLLRLAGPFPCLLRPVDLLLRAAGMRWYGYLYLSNKLWLRDRRASAPA